MRDAPSEGTVGSHGGAIVEVVAWRRERRTSSRRATPGDAPAPEVRDQHCGVEERVYDASGNCVTNFGATWQSVFCLFVTCAY